MIAKAIYYKDNKVVKESEVNIVGLPEKTDEKKTIHSLGVGRTFLHNGDLYIKTDQQKDGTTYVVELGKGTMARLSSSLEVIPKLATITVDDGTPLMLRRP